MNTGAIVGLFAIAMLLAACGSFTGPLPMPGPQAPAQPAPSPSPQPPPPTAQPPPPVVTAPPTVPPATLSADGKKLQELITQADGRLKSYKYYFSDRRPDPKIKFPLSGEFQIKGDKIRMDMRTQPEELSARQANVANTDTSLYQPQIYGDDYYDYFFLNTQKKIAFAGCQNQLCRHRGELVPVEFADYYRKTPKDWRNEIPLAAAKIIDSKQIQGQNIIRVSYTAADGTPILQWLEQYSMVPIRVDVGAEKDLYTIHFLDLAPNAVSDNVFAGVPI